jgi:hypothetical protein
MKFVSGMAGMAAIATALHAMASTPSDARGRELAEVRILWSDACCESPWVARNPSLQVWGADASEVAQMRLEASFVVDIDGVATAARIDGVGPVGPTGKPAPLQGGLKLGADRFPATIDIEAPICDEARCWLAFTAHASNREGRLVTLHMVAHE